MGVSMLYISFFNFEQLSKASVPTCALYTKIDSKFFIFYLPLKLFDNL